MRKAPNPMVEPYRIRKGAMASDESYGNCGAFMMPFNGDMFTVVISDGMDWDHVSVSTPERTPTWSEMCYFKEVLFEDDECVVQYHPPKEKHVNNHAHCLHLWHPQKDELPMPDELMVGIKELGEL